MMDKNVHLSEAELLEVIQSNRVPDGSIGSHLAQCGHCFEKYITLIEFQFVGQEDAIVQGSNRDSKRRRLLFREKRWSRSTVGALVVLALVLVGLLFRGLGQEPGESPDLRSMVGDCAVVARDDSNVLDAGDFSVCDLVWNKGLYLRVLGPGTIRWKEADGATVWIDTGALMVWRQNDSKLQVVTEIGIVEFAGTQAFIEKSGLIEIAEGEIVLHLVDSANTIEIKAGESRRPDGTMRRISLQRQKEIQTILQYIDPEDPALGGWPSIFFSGIPVGLQRLHLKTGAVLDGVVLMEGSHLKVVSRRGVHRVARDAVVRVEFLQ